MNFPCLKFGTTLHSILLFRFRIKFHGESILNLKMKIWQNLQEDSTFAQKQDETLDSKRASTFEKVQKLIELDLVPFEVVIYCMKFQAMGSQVVLLKLSF